MYHENNAEKRVEKMRKLINKALTFARDAQEKESKAYKDYDDTIKIFNEYTFW